MLDLLDLKSNRKWVVALDFVITRGPHGSIDNKYYNNLRFINFVVLIFEV